jgi:hypothetical protein
MMEKSVGATVAGAGRRSTLDAPVVAVRVLEGARALKT